MQVVPQHHFVSALHTVVCRDVDAMFNDFYNHLISAQVRGIVTPTEWSTTFSGTLGSHSRGKGFSIHTNFFICIRNLIMYFESIIDIAFYFNI